jgi:hypothetical protein
MPRKLQFLNRFTDLCIKTPKLVFTLQIGDHFFLNLNSVVNAVDPVLIMFRIFKICFYSSHAFFKFFLFGELSAARYTKKEKENTLARKDIKRGRDYTVLFLCVDYV